MSLETTVVNAQTSQSALGQKLAFAMGILGIGGAIFLSWIGHPAVGGSIGTAVIGTLAIAFLIGKADEKKSRNKKMQGE